MFSPLETQLCLRSEVRFLYFIPGGAETAGEEQSAKHGCPAEEHHPHQR